MAVILLTIAFVITILLQPLLTKMVKEAGFLRENYCHELIPVSMGIIFIFGGLIANTLVFGWGEYVVANQSFPVTAMPNEFFDSYISHAGERNVLLLFYAVIAMGLLGLIDDVWGTRATTGLKGHLLKLVRERELTTGALKALGGGFIAFSLSLFVSATIGELIVNTLLLALCTNAINLLDLRPGRAIKGFLLVIIPVLLLANDQLSVMPIVPFVGAVLAYFPLDLRAKAMMGDVGSNVLGIMIGLSLVWNYDLNLRIGALIFLIALHIYTEKYSITQTIEKIPVLRFFDELGRPQVKKRP